MAQLAQVGKKLEEFKDSNKLVFIEMNSEIFTSDFAADSWRGSYNLPSIEYYSGNSGCSIEIAIENLQEIEDEGDIYESIEDIWPDYPSKEDFFFNEEEY